VRLSALTLFCFAASVFKNAASNSNNMFKPPRVRYIHCKRLLPYNRICKGTNCSNGSAQMESNGLQDLMVIVNSREAKKAAMLHDMQEICPEYAVRSMRSDGVVAEWLVMQALLANGHISQSFAVFNCATRRSLCFPKHNTWHNFCRH